MKRRKVRWGRVLFILFAIMITVGGINMYQKYFQSKKEQTKEEGNKKEAKKDLVDVTHTPLAEAPSNSLEYHVLNDGEYLTEKGYTLIIQNGVASIDGHLVVNKTFSLPDNYQPVDPDEPVTGERCINCLEKEVMKAYREMQSDATSVGLNIYIASGYRSYSYQNTLYNNYSAVSGTDGADTYSARPGHSEHQTGLCFDLNSVDDSFADTNEGKWIANQAYLYGFIIRYPKGKESITGYQYEPWHLRYVGIELAKELYNNGDWITIEEYYGITSNY